MWSYLFECQFKGIQHDITAQVSVDPHTQTNNHTSCLVQVNINHFYINGYVHHYNENINLLNNNM